MQVLIGILLKADSKARSFQARLKSEAMVPGSLQRGIFRAIKKQSKAYDVYSWEGNRTDSRFILRPRRLWHLLRE